MAAAQRVHQMSSPTPWIAIAVVVLIVVVTVAIVVLASALSKKKLPFRAPALGRGAAPTATAAVADVFGISRRATGAPHLRLRDPRLPWHGFARLEDEAVLTALARLAHGIEPAGEPRRMLNNSLRGLETLPLRLLPVQP